MTLRHQARTLVAGLSLLVLSSTAHANFNGTVASYPHSAVARVETFKPGYYKVTYADGRAQRVLVETAAANTYHVHNATTSATFGFYDAGRSVYVMYVNKPGDSRYGYFLTTLNRSGVITVYDTSAVARNLLRRRTVVKNLPFGTSQANKQLLLQLAKSTRGMPVLFTAEPVK